MEYKSIISRSRLNLGFVALVHPLVHLPFPYLSSLRP